MSRIARLLRDNALGVVAITIALSAGAYAVDQAPKNSVTSKSIRNSTVKSIDVKDDSLTGQDINESTLALPSDAGGTVKSVTAGSGLQGGTITNTGTISFATCAVNQVLKSTGPGYACAADADTNTTYTGNSAAGIDLTGTTFGLHACPNLQVLKSNGAGYACAGDTDTNTTYSAGTGLQLNGTQFSIANNGVGSAQIADGQVGSADIADDSITAADLGFIRAASLGGGPLADGHCASVIISQTLQFAPGAPGDFTIMSTDPAMPRDIVLTGEVGPVNGNFREYYLSACNLTGSQANLPAATIKMLVISQ